MSPTLTVKARNERSRGWIPARSDNLALAPSPTLTTARWAFDNRQAAEIAGASSNSRIASVACSSRGEGPTSIVMAPSCKGSRAVGEPA